MESEIWNGHGAVLLSSHRRPMKKETSTKHLWQQGPYKVAEYTVGSKVVLEANDDYWQTDELRDPEHEANAGPFSPFIIAEDTSQHVNSIKYQ